MNDAAGSPGRSATGMWRTDSSGCLQVIIRITDTDERCTNLLGRGLDVPVGNMCVPQGYRNLPTTEKPRCCRERNALHDGLVGKVGRYSDIGTSTILLYRCSRTPKTSMTLQPPSRNASIPGNTTPTKPPLSFAKGRRITAVGYSHSFSVGSI